MKFWRRLPDKKTVPAASKVVRRTPLRKREGEPRTPLRKKWRASRRAVGFYLVVAATAGMRSEAVGVATVLN